MTPTTSPYRENEVLVARLQAGDARAAEELLRVNRKLILKAASASLGRSGSLDMDDLAQEGSLGLLHAAELFNPERGTRFSTYATPWIRQFIARAINLQGWTIRRPSHVGERARMAAATNTDQDWLASLPNVCVSLDTPMGEEGGITLADLMAAESDPEEEVISALWAGQLLDALPPKERHVLTARCGFHPQGPQTLAQIARQWGVSREWVRQIEAKALQRLRSLEE